MDEYVDPDGNTFRLLSISTISNRDEGKKDVLLQAIVTGVSEIEHYPRGVEYYCHKCNDGRGFAEKSLEFGELEDWRSIPMKYKCDRHNEFMIQQQITKGQLRKVLLTQQGVSNPISLTGYVYGDDINKIIPGVKLNLQGILRSRKNKISDLTYKRHFDITKFKLTDEKPIVPTDSEIEEFKSMDKTKLIESFAPHIRNMYLIKEGLLLCCLGGVETKDARGDINALLLGDPGLAKTQLLKFVTKIIQKSDYASGKSASGAGLFGGVDNLHDGTRIGKPGSVIMCNGGVSCIDEMEKMNPADRTYAHEVMESQTFSLRKIGIDITWEVKVSIIGAANPKKSRWNPELSIKENVNLPDSLLSRFGLIFLVRDIPVKSEDLAIAEHILKVRRGLVEKPLEPEMITKFINYAKTLKPIITKETGETLTEWWSNLRQEEQKEEALAVDIRTLEDLYRLTEAYAKLHLSIEATKEHANMAIKMLNDSLHTLGMNTPGEKNTSITESFDKMGYIRFVFMKPIPRAVAIAKLCEKHKWFPSEERAEDEITKLHGKGILAEIGGKYQWV